MSQMWFKTTKDNTLMAKTKKEAPTELEAAMKEYSLSPFLVDDPNGNVTFADNEANAVKEAESAIASLSDEYAVGVYKLVAIVFKTKDTKVVR